MNQKNTIKELDEINEDPQLSEAKKLYQIMNSNAHGKEELFYILQKLEELPYFKQFIAEKLQKGTQRNDLLELCSRLRMEYFKGGDILFQENDSSNDKLYIIFYGEVLLMRMKKMDQLMTVQRQNSESVQQLQQKQQQQLKITAILNAKRITHKIIKHHNDQKDNRINREEKLILEEKYGECLRIMGQGNGFGEKALAENIPRTLTVASNSLDLYVIVLKKEDFLTYQMAFEKTKREKQLLMFNIFKNVNNEYSSQRLESMIYSCQTIVYERGTQLTTEFESGDAFYIIISGDITLSKKKDEKIISLCIVSSGHLLGEEIIVNKMGLYEYTSEVTSLMAKVIVIDAQDFIHKFPEECRTQINFDYKQKTINRKQLLFLLSQKQVIEVCKPKLEKEQIIKLTEMDREQRYKNKHKSVEDEQKSSDLQLNQNFLLRYSNPSVQNFCIQSIINREKKFQKQLNLQINGENGFKEFDFGNTPNDQIKRRKFLFQNKLTSKQPLQNFLKPSQKILPTVIKKDLIKNFRHATKRQIYLSQINIHAYANPTTSSSKCSRYVFTEQRDSSTNIYTQFDDKTSII